MASRQQFQNPAPAALWAGLSQPAKVLKCRLTRGQQEVLVQWKGKPPAETSWMPLDDFHQVYLAFQLEVELLA
jgi:hypothetical protein